MDLDEGEERPRNHFVGYRAATHEPAERPTLTAEEVRRILALPVGSARGSPAVKLRDQALFVFLLSTGSRVSAALEVNLGDLRPDRHLVYLRKTKGRRPYEALLIPEAWEVLELYIRTARNVLLKSPRYGPLGDAQEQDTRAPRRPTTDALWIGRGGRRLGRGAALHAIRGLAERAGLATPIGPHGVRHTGATLLEEAGAELPDIQEYLGHKDIRSTQRYVHFDHLRKLRRVEEIQPLGTLPREFVGSEEEVAVTRPPAAARRGKVIPFPKR
ncbi:MAG: tyrosine-type recombinase/integrase [Candidatus Thermoplasmatota archaeon]|nr:tyrosine-type recombinase/integrase [Candidatus Thermoplasmatota archaeon]